MRIAILGATSVIGRDLQRYFCNCSDHDLVLYARRTDALSHWLASEGLLGRYTVANLGGFGAAERFDALINLIGVGDPAQMLTAGSAIFDTTLKYDSMALEYVKLHPECRYIFLSSGAAYGSNFDTPADGHTNAIIPINELRTYDWYGVAKLHAECRHRALPHLPIVDLRVFNYFSRTQDVAARFLMTDIVRAIQNKTTLTTSPQYIVRDFIHPSDLFSLTAAVLASPPVNTSADCYSKQPVDKPALLLAMETEFGLRYEVSQKPVDVNATGIKCQYYSLDRRAAHFGYQPLYTSLHAVLEEAAAMLSQEIQLKG